MKSCSLDLRERIVYFRQLGESAKQTSIRLKISKRTVERIWRKYLDEGSIEARQRGGYKRSRLEPVMKILKRWLKSDSNITLSDMSERCLQEFGIRINSTALWQQLDKHGLSYKKNSTRQRARQRGRTSKA